MQPAQANGALQSNPNASDFFCTPTAAATAALRLPASCASTRRRRIRSLRLQQHHVWLRGRRRCQANDGADIHTSPRRCAAERRHLPLQLAYALCLRCQVLLQAVHQQVVLLQLVLVVQLHGLCLIGVVPKQRRERYRRVCATLVQLDVKLQTSCNKRANGSTWAHGLQP